MELEPHILALIGAATAAAGVGLVVFSASAVSDRKSSGTAESLLAPTLAVDTLDTDLRVAYMRTLVLDARFQARHQTTTPLGRELRRALVSLQAVRFSNGTADDQHGLVDLVNDACDVVEQGRDHDDDREAWISRAREIRSSLKPSSDR